jgi:hypothetical protein
MTPTNERTRTVDRSTSLAVAMGLAAGVAIALIDSSPGWDDTGITAGLLFVGAGAAAAVGRNRPWLWALLVGLPTPILETVQSGALGSWLAVIFAAAGAAAGWGVARAGR